MKDGAHVTAKDISKIFPISVISLQYEPGPMQERSEILVPQVENDSTTDKTASTSYQGQKALGSKRKSLTRESLHTSKMKTTSIRKKTSTPHTLTKSSFPTSDKASTSKENVYDNDWNPYVKELSIRFWLPIKTVSRTSPLTISILSASKPDAKSWFTVQKTRASHNSIESVSSAKTFWLSQHISQLHTMASIMLTTYVNEHMVQEMNESDVSVAQISDRQMKAMNRIMLEHKIESLYALKATDHQKIYNKNHEVKILALFSLDKNFRSSSQEYVYVRDTLKDNYYKVGYSYHHYKDGALFVDLLDAV